MKYLRRLLLVLLALIFLVSAFLVGRYVWQSFQTQRDFQQLQEEESKNRDLKALWNRNPDLIGWISIAGTEIDYPVMQTKEEPEFYLRRNFKKEYSLAGTPFLDAASDVALPTSNWLLYGHNMQDGTMFHDLLNYAEESFYRKHPTVSFETVRDGAETYEIIAAFYAEVDTEGFRYYDYAKMTTPEDYTTYVREVKAASCYDTKKTAVYGEQLLTLSTCSYHVPDKKGRFVVVAKQKI